VDVDRKQDELDRHQDDDDVLPVQEDAKNPECEQDCGDREVVSKADGHAARPATLAFLPGRAAARAGLPNQRSKPWIPGSRTLLAPRSDAERLALILTTP